jgi:hypothetical protein
MKKHLVTIAPKRALTQPTRKSPPAKAPPPSKAEQDFNKAAELRRKFPLLAAAPAAKRRMRTAALAYAAELTAKKGGKR